MLHLEGIAKTFNLGTPNEKVIFQNLQLHLTEGDYTVVIGGNGSGKSTLLNCISGQLSVERGTIRLMGRDVTKTPEHKRAAILARVFQDPLMGTSASMTIEENLALAARKGKRVGLKWGIPSWKRTAFEEALKGLGLGLEERLTTKAGFLSGGQRQALTLLMATLRKPQLLLLDEHTAALDPKTAAIVLQLTDELIRQNRLTTLMVTHNLQDAIKYGDRLLMMRNGEIILDVRGSEKRNLTVETLLDRFHKPGGPSQELPLLA